MLKRIIEAVFGAKLPCGCGGRFRMKLSKNVTCPKCGNTYFRVRFVCDKPRAVGKLVNTGEFE